MKKDTIFVVSFYLAVFSGLAFLNLSLFNYACDDAYIHFRIAENFLLHGKPYYNMDEPLMASSSSGWTLTLLALFFLAGVKLKAVSIFNAAATTLAVYAYARVVDEAAGARKFSHDLTVATVLLPILLYSDIGLMETPLALLLLGLGVLLYLRKDGLSFLLFGMCVFFRLELVVFLLLFMAFNLYSKAVPAWKMGLFVFLGAAPFLVYDYAFFGTAIPHTVRAKSVIYMLSRADVVQMAVPGYFFKGDNGVKAESIFLMLLFYAALRAALKNRRGLGRGVLLVLLSGGALVFLAYFFEKTFICYWYTPLFYAPVFISSLIYARDRKNPVLGAVLLLAYLPFGAVFCTAVYASVFDKTAYPKFCDDARVQKYLEVGRRLYEKYPGHTLMTSEIGGLGFSFKGKVYDGAGLVSEGALKYHPMKVPGQRPGGGFGSIPAGYVKEIQPGIIVTYDMYMDGLITPDILDKYIKIKDDIYAPEDLSILRKKGIPTEKRLFILIRKERFTKGF